MTLIGGMRMSINKIIFYSFTFLLSSNLLFISTIFTSKFLLHSLSPTLDLHFISPAKEGSNLKMVLHLRLVLGQGGKDCTASIRDTHCHSDHLYTYFNYSIVSQRGTSNICLIPPPPFAYFYPSLHLPLPRDHLPNSSLYCSVWCIIVFLASLGSASKCQQHSAPYKYTPPPPHFHMPLLKSH